MRTLRVFLFVMAGCAGQAKPAPTTPTPAPSGDLEARVRQLEAKNAKYAEALDFLQKVYDQQKQQQAQEDRDELAPDGMFAVDIAADVAAGQVDGPASAAVTIVKCFDFACPYCARAAPTMDALVKDYAGKVRVVYKNLVVHPQVAMPAHLASCAAAKQGKYLAFKNAFWEQAFQPYLDSHDPAKLGRDNILAIAKKLGLDTKRLETDMDGADCRARIDSDAAELAKFKVNSTPMFFINGTPIAGALPLEEMKVVVDAQLKLVAASGVAPAKYYDQEVMAKGEKAFRSRVDPKPKN
jgi:protein-disulfide isomerase